MRCGAGRSRRACRRTSSTRIVSPSSVHGLEYRVPSRTDQDGVSTMPLTIGPRLRGFFEEKLAAIITTVNDRGVPEMTPLWYEFDGTNIRINGDKTRVWMARMEKTGRATFFVMDPVNLWRWVQVYGNVIEA